MSSHNQLVTLCKVYPYGEMKLIVRRDEQGREARRVGGRTCFWRSLYFSLKAGRQGHFFGFAFLTADFLAPVNKVRK
jgi:hypothetical protein